VTIAGQTFEPGQMMVFRPSDRVSMTARDQGARVMLLGGATLEGPRHIWWNFVASNQEKIDAAKEAWRAGDWEHGRFQLPPTDNSEFIPLPEKRLSKRGASRLWRCVEAPRAAPLHAPASIRC